MHLEQLQHRRMRHHRLDGVEDRVHWPVAGGLMRDLFAVDVERQRRRLRAAGAGDDRQSRDLDSLVGVAISSSTSAMMSSS